ncbi:unnamed protein product [Sphagnum troendelagicum]|uniref:Clp R domain-containing protein n=1 Tax=Sphagnum troendelagicum TaxID=128251 RepID=A0ABP0TRM5_9BRYO
MHAAFLLLRALRSGSSYTSGFGHDSHALALVACLGFGSFLLRFLPRSFIVICVLQSDMAATLFGCAAGSRAVKSFSDRLSKSVALNVAVAGSGLVCGAAPKQQHLQMASCSIIMANRGGGGRFLFSRALSSSCINPWPGFSSFKLERFGARKEIEQGEFTEMAWQAITAAIDVVRESKLQVVEPEHLMNALLEQKNGLAR